MTERILLAALYVVGLGLTVVNGWLAFVDTEQRLKRYTSRIVHSDRYAQEKKSGVADPVVRRREHIAPPVEGSDHDPTAHELAEHLIEGFRRNRLKLLLAALGLLLTSTASILSLFL